MLPKENAADLYLRSLGSEASRVRMRIQIRRLERLAAERLQIRIDWNRLSEPLVLSLRNLLREDHAGVNYTNFNLSLLKGIAKAAARLETISQGTLMHILSVSKLRGSRLRRGSKISSGEIRAIFAERTTSLSNLECRNLAIFALAASCGLRRSEIASVLLENLDPAGGRVAIIGKGNKEREVYFDDPFTPIFLTAWLERRGKGGNAFFTPLNRFGLPLTERPLSSEAVYLAVKRIAGKYGIRDLTPHDLRRFFASSLLRQNIDINTVREAMGHQSIATTQLYDVRPRERLRECTVKY